MFGVESCIPVDFGVVEAKGAIGLVDLDVHVVLTSKDFILEGSVFIFFTHVVDLVNDKSDSGVLVE